MRALYPPAASPLGKNNRPKTPRTSTIGSDFSSFSGVRKVGRRKSTIRLRNSEGANMPATAEIMDMTRLQASRTSATVRAQKARGQAKASERQQRGSIGTR